MLIICLTMAAYAGQQENEFYLSSRKVLLRTTLGYETGEPLAAQVRENLVKTLKNTNM